MMNRIPLKNVFLSVTAWLLLPAALSFGGRLLISIPGQDNVPVSVLSVLYDQEQDQKIRVFAEGAIAASQPGQPEIPWQKLTVLLPPSADLDSISARLEDVQYAAITGNWEIDPTPPIATGDIENRPSLIWPEGAMIEEGRDISIYSANEFWPGRIVLVTHKGQLHQWQLVELAVPLIQYNPAAGQIQELLEARVVVEYSRYSRKRGSGPAAVMSNRGRQRVRRIAINFAAAAGDYDLAAQPAPARESDAPSKSTGAAGINSKGYLIMTTSAIVAQSAKLADFISHKQSMGWTVSVITEAQWGGGVGETAAINIRNWLRSNYINLDALYVLLIGNPHPETGDVPMRWYNDGFETNGIYGAPTDALYSDLSSADGWDKFWEVIAGRIPYYGKISDLDAILQKTIAYETSQQIAWRWNALLPMVPLDDTTPSYQCGQQIKTNLLSPNDILSTRIYKKNYDLNPPPEYLLAGRYPAAEWGSQPYGLVAWITHGSPTSATDVITTSAVSQLNNAYPSVVYEGSCENAHPENTGNLAYKILLNGGITTVAATRNSYYTPGQTNYTSGKSIGTLAYFYVSNLTDERQSCGLALAEAKKTLDLYKANAVRMVLYGDPSVAVFTDQDFTPPQPDPMTWEVEPYEVSPGTVFMTATAAVDEGGGGVEYYFQCVHGGGSDSGWQSSPIYLDSDLTSLYTVYRVKARDLSDSKNETDYSAPAAVEISPYPYGGQPRSIPGKIQAEHFDAGGQGVTYYDTTAGNSDGLFRSREDVDICAINDGVRDYAVSSIATGEWLVYTVNSSGGTVDFYARVASETSHGQLVISMDGQVLGSADIPNTGSLSTWQNVRIPDVVLTECENTKLKIEFFGTGFQLNWIAFQNQLPYWGSPSVIEGRIEFEDFDIGGQDIAYYDVSPFLNGYGYYRPDEGVEIMAMTDEGSPAYAVWMDPTEWMEYTCAIQPGYYTVIIRHASSSLDQGLILLQEGQERAQILLPSTGGWNKWQSTAVSGVYLDGGSEQILRFHMASSSAFLNYADFVREYNPADLNRSGRVDLEDFSILSDQWLSAPGTPTADIATDLGDGIVDVEDLIILVDNWLRVE